MFFSDAGTMPPMTEIELTGIVGADAARKLVNRFGGADLNIPRDIKTPFGKELVGVIGAVPTSALIQWARGCRIYLQRNAERERQIRVSEIRKLINQGKTVSEISRSFTYETRLTERQIYQLLRNTS